jgi:hypothetical protein
VYKNTRGLELPGSHNHAFLSELFHEQSSRWPGIASQHIRQVHEEASNFSRRALSFVVEDRHVGAEILILVTAILDQNFRSAQEELRKICDDEKIQPLTYNHYYTETIQDSRLAKVQGVLRGILSTARTSQGGQLKIGTEEDIQSLCASFNEHNTLDMDQTACNEAIESLNAYYKVSPRYNIFVILSNYQVLAIDEDFCGQYQSTGA